MVALVLARVGLLPRAMASLQACLQLQPEHPLAHYTLAQFLRTQDQQEAALRSYVAGVARSQGAGRYRPRCSHLRDAESTPHIAGDDAPV